MCIRDRDYFEVRKQAPGIVAAIRQGMGPALVHATVNRPYSHSSADTQSKYRPKSELDDEAWTDPIAALERAILEGQILSPDEMAEMREEARRLVAEAAKDALLAERPDPTTVRSHLLELPEVSPAESSEKAAAGAPGNSEGPVVALGEGVRLALHEAMSDDVRVRVFGEDVADAPEELLDELEGKGGVLSLIHI